ncbi:iron-containing alcohol dehydrogenase [Shewanella sp. D64]|uniref:iron-containing alcohol dehydrogenase n=1 Tax=unclassified Shewanella TaxID=196818 RepID=UPI0022BA38A4|nr:MULTISPECIES: iron-containing alcohol dehydrogenase [unclassified Shewanella]MEC4724358.1 iron-containing alcohol dehydrogenase [Shewanella sp. D64]MEC4738870.1 iron-containing alcohol dehydrogenase [Shewanella sp. E94]WBJ97693.1 iron-containing alcohol dehydrogenase [Shewanella sp. MTB7]
MDLHASWNFPTAITVGEGCLAQLGERCKALNMTKVLLITDPGLVSLPMVKEAVGYCRKSGLEAKTFSDIQGNPTGQNVRDGALFLNAGGFDGVVAFGGGSSLDAAKAIAMIAKQKLSLWSTEDIGNNWTRIEENLMLPVVAVPTTAGTGSEVGRASVITDTDGSHHIKRIIFHPNMLPASVLLDPLLTLGLPPHITAATGLDALSHNLEAYCAPFYHPMAEGIAIEGIRLIKHYLPRAVADGKDIEARTQMLVASSMGATSFQRGLGGMHAIAHSLGALYNKHHGLLNAILMPYVLTRNRSVIEDRIIRLSRYLELDDATFTGFLSWILTLREQLNIPHTLAEIGINIDDAVLVGKMSVKDAACAGNPILLTDIEYSLLFKDAVKGKLK